MCAVAHISTVCKAHVSQRKTHASNAWADACTTHPCARSGAPEWIYFNPRSIWYRKNWWCSGVRSSLALMTCIPSMGSVITHFKATHMSNGPCAPLTCTCETERCGMRRSKEPDKTGFGLCHNRLTQSPPMPKLGGQCLTCTTWLNASPMQISLSEHKHDVHVVFFVSAP